MATNSQNIVSALQNFRQLLRNRLESHLKKEDKELADIFPAVQLAEDRTALHHFIIQHQFTVEEYIALMTALVPHIQPAFFENLIDRKSVV